MLWTNHSSNVGQHAMFSPSSPAYLNCTPEEFKTRMGNKMRSALGTEIHEWCYYRILEFEKVSSAREVLKGVKEHIFKKKYLTDERVLSREGKRLINGLAYLPSEVFETAKKYVNDSIVFRMDPEVVLQYSPRTFGTVDSISFSNNFLRIHDLKTGSTPAHIEQLMGYDAYFCLEYDVDPNYIQHELRIYQNNDILVHSPTGPEIKDLMNKIVIFDGLQKEFEED